MKKSGPHKRKQAELEEKQMKIKQSGKNNKTLDDQQRSIHEAYQILLNEYYTRKAYRDKTGGQALKKTAKMLMSASAVKNAQEGIIDNVDNDAGEIEFEQLIPKHQGYIKLKLDEHKSYTRYGVVSGTVVAIKYCKLLLQLHTMRDMWFRNFNNVS